jgi:hypothetical protein
MCLGNLPPGSEIILTMSMTLIGASSSPNSLFFKFPFESCSPDGIIVTLDSQNLSSFLFQQEIEGSEPIRNVQSNIGGEWFPRNEKSGLFRLTHPTRDSSLILTTTFVERMAPLTAIQFGNIVTAFAMPDIIASIAPPQEYIFVLDCSGSMSGQRLAQAISCLRLYLHSLPCEGQFNILRFGSQTEQMWSSSRVMNEETVSAALKYVSTLRANLGGTEMSKALNWIVKQPLSFPGRKRQLFILTDGEDFHPDEVMRLVTSHRNEIRCFTIGLGRGADPGLVKGIANRTNGRYDFVCNGVDLRSKVIGHLSAATTASIENVEIHVSGVGSQHQLESPIQPLITGDLSTIFIRCQQLSGDSSVLLTGMENDRNIEYVSRTMPFCDDQSMIDAVAKYAASIEITDLQRQVSTHVGNTAQMNEMIRLIKTISVSSGILSPYTSFVGIVTQTAFRRSRRVFVWCGFKLCDICVELDPDDSNPCETIHRAVQSKLESPSDLLRIDFGRQDFHDCQVLRGYLTATEETEVFVKNLSGNQITIVIEPTETVLDFKMKIQAEQGLPPDQQRLIFYGKQLIDEELMGMYLLGPRTKLFHMVLRLRGGGLPEVMESELERAQKEKDISSFLDGHSAEGFWGDSIQMMAKSGLTEPPMLPQITSDNAEKVLATVLAIALLRKRYSDEVGLWRLLEQKALQWLKRIDSRVNWSEIIHRVVELLASDT